MKGVSGVSVELFTGWNQAYTETFSWVTGLWLVWAWTLHTELLVQFISDREESLILLLLLILCSPH